MNTAPKPKPIKEATDAIGSTERRPSFLDALGIGRSEWLINTKPQITGLNREGHGEIYRIWAILNLHSMGYQSECAVKQVPLEKLKSKAEVIGRGQYKDSAGRVAGEYALVPLAPVDIVEESKVAGFEIQAPNVARGLRELERMGHIRCEGRTKGKVRILFLARPEPSKILIRLDKNVASYPPQMGVEESQEAAKKIISLTARVRKRYFPKFNGTLPLNPSFVIKLDYQKAVDERAEKIWARTQEFLAAEWQKEIRDLDRIYSEGHLVIKNPSAYKEERNLERNLSLKEQSGRLVGAENTARDNQTGATDQPTDTPSQNALDQTHPATFQELTAYLGEFSEHTHKQPTTRDVQTVLDACAKRLSVAQLREFVAGRMAQAKALVVTGYGIFAVIARELAPLAADWKPAAPVKHKVSLAEFRQRFDALYESWKKTGSGDRTSRAACSKLLADALKQGANLEYIEAGIAAWTAFHAEVGWKFCKPTLADMLQNRTWDMLPPDPHGGEKKSSGEKAFDMVYELHRDRKKGGPYGS